MPRLIDTLRCWFGQHAFAPEWIDGVEDVWYCIHCGYRELRYKSEITRDKCEKPAPEIGEFEKWWRETVPKIFGTARKLCESCGCDPKAPRYYGKNGLVCRRCFDAETE